MPKCQKRHAGEAQYSQESGILGPDLSMHGMHQDEFPRADQLGTQNLRRSDIGRIKDKKTEGEMQSQKGRSIETTESKKVAKGLTDNR